LNREKKRAENISRARQEAGKGPSRRAWLGKENRLAVQGETGGNASGTSPPLLIRKKKAASPV